MPTDFDKLDITITPDGTATLSGINYDDLRTILTAASLYRGDHPPKIEPLDGKLDEVVHQNNVYEAKWHLRSEFLNEVLHAKMGEAIRPGYGDGNLMTIKALHKFRMDSVEETVREAERNATPAVEKPDLIADAALEITQALRAADLAIAKLNHARRAMHEITVEFPLPGMPGIAGQHRLLIKKKGLRSPFLLSGSVRE
jgi:hypothetical protein